MQNIYDIDVKTIDGKSQSLSDFKGKALLIVNVASKCGLTPQYEQLEALYEAEKDKGFAVLGFPCNQFAGQEPGSEEEIQSFCRSTFGVEFPMFSKIDVNGDDRHPLYQTLIAAKPNAQRVPDSQLEKILTEKGLAGSEPTDVMWNFEKFVVNRDGEVVGRFAPDMTVDQEPLKTALQQTIG
ncbi:glutathione peroxidase [Aliidiomarina celeris]|uniref:glutathione peroxidase n=1 Tax=Aliidiomarina celeris TaxID=2249428 RepID=UPI000DEA05C1|nr:redoxin domain-containing protein [Aliidiomarina celeris]